MGDNTERLAWAEEQLAAVKAVATAEVVATLKAGMPEESMSRIQDIVEREILPKTLAFCPALTVNERLQDVSRLGAVTAAVSYMYWGDQTMDRGDAAMFSAIQLLNGVSIPAEQDTSLVRARYKALMAIEVKINQLAKPEDAPFVLACFNDQVLGNEAAMHDLSQQYLDSKRAPTFLAKHARQLADLMTVSAGFPSISSSLYAIYRQHDASLPALPAIYANEHMVNLLQVCNVVVRLWDELGDWEMDSGKYPESGKFVVNPFNQYDPAIIDHFNDLAAIKDQEQRKSMHQAFQNFHNSTKERRSASTYILDTLSRHIRHYIATLPAVTRQEFSQYIELCKRVLEIGYVNHIGDMELANPEVRVGRHGY